MALHTLSIPAMKCPGCVSTVESALSTLNTVQNVAVDLHNKLVTIEAESDISVLITVVVDSGFPAEVA